MVFNYLVVCLRTPILWGFSIDNNDFYTVQTVSPNPTPKQQPSQKTLCKKKQKHLV